MNNHTKQQHEPDKPQVHQQLRIYSHSSFFYWWPVWVVGYIMAFLTYSHGRPDQIEAIGQAREWFHPSNNLGVVYLLVLFLVILITNFSVRGLASGMVIMGAVLLVVVLAWVGWWDEVFSWFSHLRIHLTLGAYFWFSTLMFLTWAVTVFGLDRLSYWEFTPGQLTHKSLYGAGSKSYNAQGMGLEKHRDDLFRHWLLGLGSGDLKISTSGATREQIDVPNVLFIGSKVEAMQRLISEVPEGQETS
jgi:energy-coupling factor transporter transmembrane protein EcfT